MSDSDHEPYTQPITQGCEYILDAQEDYDFNADNKYESSPDSREARKFRDSPPSASESTACSTNTSDSSDDANINLRVFKQLQRRLKCLFKIKNTISARNSFFPKLRADLQLALDNLDFLSVPTKAPKKRKLVCLSDTSSVADQDLGKEEEPLTQKSVAESVDDIAESVTDVAESVHSSDNYSDDLSDASDGTVVVLSSDDECTYKPRPTKRAR